MEIKAENVTRTFGTKRAIDELNFILPEGVYGLLGDNGAGKSTLMRILVAIDHQTSGKVTFNGKDIFHMNDDYRNLVGYIPQDFEVYPAFTATEYLEYMGALKGLSKKELKHKVPEVLQFVNLEKVANKKVKTFSGGMKRRVGIAQAIINDPKILIFDEPTAGLDPHERIRFSNIISEMGQDKIILFSTHIISDIEAITTNVIILNQGKIKEQGNVQKMLSGIKGKVFTEEMDRERLASFKKEHLIVRIRQEENAVSVRYLGEKESGAIVCEPTLEDYYIHLGSGSHA
ncbi:ABC transporter ATP-binding protein [Paenibacillus sp. FSL H7-0357]|uniref:ABC transporter ATP-binding protein n=1 Tax=unclassified Paenibacillus TaxID=185978 RepID=UPI0004F65C18|nr:ABC transporter ATP-binding protein [Paenibacillus sp. FSL H7-0357]AIQ18454.1 ABC transporter ATP-binding protein [Paenibacillus sp. FSL H7-0357]